LEYLLIVLMALVYIASGRKSPYKPTRRAVFAEFGLRRLA